MSERTGIPLGTYRRYDRGLVSEPNLRHLVNIALVLGCQLRDLLEEEWLEWKVFDARAPGPPERSGT